MSGAPGLRLDIDGQVATATLDRADKRNALTAAMWEAIPRLVDEACGDPSVRVLVVRGSGEHFCAGADVAELGRALALDTDAVRYRSLNDAAERALAAAPVTTIAAIDGACVGGGVQLAVACDIRIATARARFGVTPGRLGITYPALSLERLVATVGAPAARRLLATAELVDATAALSIGLVSEVVHPDELAAATARVATTVRSTSPTTQLAAKAMIDEIVRTGSVPAALAATWERRAAAGADLSEGLAAFSERRSPNFGRRPDDGGRG